MSVSTMSAYDVGQTRRIGKKFHVLWLTDNVEKLKTNFAAPLRDLHTVSDSIETFNDADSLTNYLFEHTQKKIILIVPGTMGESIMSLIHDIPHLDSIFVFCYDIARHEKWATKWTKVKGVFRDVHAMCDAVKQAIDQSESTRPRTRRPFTPDSSDGRSTPSLVNSSVTTVPSRSTAWQPSLPTLEELQTTIIARTERGIRRSMLDSTTISRLQDTLRQTIDKRVTARSDHGFDPRQLSCDLKRSLVEVLMQEQLPLLQDAIKQSVAAALKEQSPSVSSLLTARPSSVRKPIVVGTPPVVRIAADTKKTRTDAAFRQQRDSVVANTRLRDVVQHWTAVTSMADLAASIRASTSSDLECAWLLFCWIGQNIRYAANCSINKAETVFRNRQGVCRGFASLYHECCTLLNIQCAEISGFVKNSFVKTNEELKRFPHAWNTIVLDSLTYLVDPTWGAGGRDNQHSLEDFYFLTAPEEFIYSHYSMGSQLLAPEITKDEFLSLPVMNSIYYRLGLNLLSPKQGFNRIDGNLFQISIRTPVNVDLCAGLKVGHEQYPRTLHTLCQRDANNRDVYQCSIAPPVDGLYEIDIYAKTDREVSYQGAINMHLQVANVTDAFMFPTTYKSFTEHDCILVEPLQRFVNRNEEVLIQMVIPRANVIKIKNGDDHMVPSNDEYKNGVLKKKVRVQGDLQVCGRWDDEADTISVLCAFNMI